MRKNLPVPPGPRPPLTATRSILRAVLLGVVYSYRLVPAGLRGSLNAGQPTSHLAVAYIRAGYGLHAFLAFALPSGFVKKGPFWDPIDARSRF